MARVPYLSKDDLAPEDREVLERDINLVKALANNPPAARALINLIGYIRYESKLDDRLRELAIIQVGYLARSPYEYSHHLKISLDSGVSEDDIHAMVAETEGRNSDLEPLAKLVLRTAREITQDGEASAKSFAELEQHLGHDLIIELLLAIAFYNAVVRMLGSLQIDVEDDYQIYLDRFPLPED